MKSYSFLNQILAENNSDGISLVLKAEIDNLVGRNDELRAQLAQVKADFNRAQLSASKAQEEVKKNLF
jgi:hypothetical protein